jgi:hypothetical protein
MQAKEGAASSELGFRPWFGTPVWCKQKILVFRGDRTRQASRQELGSAVHGYLNTVRAQSQPE